MYVAVPDPGWTPIGDWLGMAEAEGPATEHGGHRASPTATGETDTSRAWSDPSYLRFTFIRDPFTRALQAYLDQEANGQGERERRRPQLGLRRQASSDFHRFLLRVERQDLRSRPAELLPQTTLLGLPRSHYDRVYRFENFDTSLRRLTSAIGIPSIENYPIDLQYRSAAAEVSLTDFYGDNEEALVTRIYADDFRFLGYRTSIH